MPHFLIVLILYINLFKLSWLIKCLFLGIMEPLTSMNNLVLIFHHFRVRHRIKMIKPFSNLELFCFFDLEFWPSQYCYGHVEPVSQPTNNFY